MNTVDHQIPGAEHAPERGGASHYLSVSRGDETQTLAWVNSLCLLFLVIGGLGVKLPKVFVKAVPPVEEVIPVVIQPLSPPPPVAEKETPREQNEPEKPEAAQVVAVTLNSPKINFSVPTVGNLLVATPIAAVPTLAIARPLTAPGEGAGKKAEVPPPPRPTVVSDTGASGDRPQPGYPKIALEQGEQGTVVLLLTVDDVGAITSAEVKETSGFPLLDRSAAEFVKRHWRIPPEPNSRLFEATIKYLLRVGAR